MIKIKNNKIRKKIILVLVLLVFYKVMTSSVSGVEFTPQKTSCIPPVKGEEITFEELNSFLAVWPQYAIQGFEVPDPRQISTFADMPSQALPWKIRFWLFKHCWDSDRFYYVEQRIRQIIQTSRLRRHNNDVIALLEKIMAEDGGNGKAEIYQQMIERQQKITGVERISEQELELVRGRENDIEEILDESGLPDSL